MENAGIKKFIFCMAVFVLYSACQKQIPTDTDFTQVTRQEIDSLIGKKLQLDQNHIVLNSNGAVTGTWSDSPVAGTWQIKDGLWCRQYSQFNPAKFIGTEECHLWEVTDNKIIATRDSGNGSAYEYTIEN